MYTQQRSVTYSEVSMNGYADEAQIADYFQDCSCFQSDALGVGMVYLSQEHLAWLLASWQIVIMEHPKYGDTLTVATWPYDFDAVFGYRNFSMCDQNGKVLAMANSQWILVNTDTGHPVKITEEVIQHYEMEAKAEMHYASRKIKFKGVDEARPCLTVPRALIDTNHHVNNAQYIRMALEYVPEDFKIGQVRVEYKKAAVLGDCIYPYVDNDGHLFKVLLTDADQLPYAVVEFQRMNDGEKND